MPVIKKPKDDRGHYRTVSLIYEYPSVEKWSPEVTFGTEDLVLDDGTVITSLHKIYMEEADPTEYKFAMRVFGEWKHFQRWISGSNSFITEKMNEYRDELSVKIKSEAIKEVIKKAKNSTAAAQYVAEEGWNKRKRAGRPLKAEVERETKVQARTSKVIKDDMERVGLSVVKK